MTAPTPLEQLMRTTTTPRKVSIGLPASLSDAERRFPLTPEAAALLVDRGFDVRVERGASASIHYTDEAYSRRGVRVVDRAAAFCSDIVVYLPAIGEPDAMKMRRGALLLGFAHMPSQTPRALKSILNNGVTAIALDRIGDGNLHPFADIIDEINGRAAMAIASSLLADAIHGKGILLGGVAGVVPCELTILGADLAAEAAAKTALGLGATVRVFDNDVYRLRRLETSVGGNVIASTMHPRVVLSALRSADIVVACSMKRPFEIGQDAVAEMKKGVIVFDLDAVHPSFPSLPTVDLANASPVDNPVDGTRRVCYINAGNAVPRTAAMALSNTLLSVFDDIIACESAINALKLIPGLRRAAYTFMGKPVDAEVAAMVGARHVDINLLLQFS